jgi:hypothetical protein
MNLGAPISKPDEGMPQPPAAIGQPFPAADTAWRSSSHASNPSLAVSPSMIVTVAATVPVWYEPAVTLDAPRPAGTYISRAVSDAVILPASYRPPTVKNPPVLTAVRASIERACAGRGRDLEIVPHGPASLLVRLKVRQSADAEYLANLIARLPELGPYHVLFEMQVAR